jgi:hypothetical protein
MLREIALSAATASAIGLRATKHSTGNTPGVSVQLRLPQVVKQ